MGDLSTELGDLFSRVTTVKSEVYAAVTGHQGAMELTFRNAGALGDKVEELATQLQAVAGAKGLAASLEQGSTEWIRLSTQLRTSEAVVAVLRQLAELRETLAKADEALDAAEFLAAAEAVVRLQELADALPGAAAAATSSPSPSPSADSADAAEDDDDPKLLRLVRRQCRQRRARLTERLDQLLWLGVAVSARELRISPHLSGSFGHMHLERPVPVGDVLAALGVLGLLEARMATLAAQLQEHVLGPLTTDAALVPEAAAGTLLLSGEGGGPAPPPAQLAPRVAAVLTFLHGALPAVVAPLGAALWPAVAALLTGALREAIPEDGAALDAYIARAEEASARLERQLADIGFAPAGDDTLTAFLRDVNRHFARKRRAQLLVRARDALKEQYHNTVTVDDGQTVVTRAAQELLQMARDTLEEAAAARAPESAQTLYNTARHLFELFRAVVPTLHADALASDSLHARTALLFYNDCQFLARAMAALPLDVRPRLPAPLDRTATFADLVAPLRNLGERYLVGQVQAQAALVAALAAEVSLDGCADASDGGERAERDVARLAARVRAVADAWRPVLPADTLARALAEVVRAAADPLTRDVLARADIGVDEGAAMHRALAQLLPLLSSESAGGLAPASRFAAVVSMLDDRLATIRQRWQAGALAALEAHEVAGMVRAIFEETPAREELLGML